MKLYTEEQVRQAYNLGFVDGYDVEEKCENSAMSLLIPIELPSDEEMEKEAFQIPFNNTNEFYDKSFIKGAKWMKQQILKQNK